MTKIIDKSFKVKSLNKIEKIEFYLLAFFVGISPINLFIGISPSNIRLLKIIFLAIIIFYFHFVKNLTFKKEIFYIIIAFLICFIPSSLKIDNILIWITEVIYLILPFLVFSTFYNFFKKKDNNTIFYFLQLSTIIIAPFCFLVLLNYFTGVPKWFNLIIDNNKSFFLNERTTWSPSISFFSMISFYFFIHEKIKIKKGFYFLLFLIIFLSQLFSGGRSGVLISSLFVLYYILYKNKLVFKILFISIFYFLFFYNLTAIKNIMRLKDTPNLSKKELAIFSAGRTEQYSPALKKIKKDYVLILGNGLANGHVIKYYHPYYSDPFIKNIHNFWFAILLRAGLFSLIFYIIITIFFIRRLYKLFKINKKYDIFIISIISGLTATLFESNLIFAKTLTTLGWWVLLAAGFAIYNKEIKRFS